MNFAKGGLGWIEVVCGPMFSGKSEELIRRLRRAEIARQRVQIFKPGVDQRYSDDHIVSHSELRIRSESVRDAADIQARLDWRTEVIGLDEARCRRCFEPNLAKLTARRNGNGEATSVAASAAAPQ